VFFEVILYIKVQVYDSRIFVSSVTFSYRLDLVDSVALAFFSILFDLAKYIIREYVYIPRADARARRDNADFSTRVFQRAKGLRLPPKISETVRYKRQYHCSAGKRLLDYVIIQVYVLSISRYIFSN